MLNVTVLVVRVWWRAIKIILILNVTWFLRGSDGGQYREILILNVTVLVVRLWRKEI